MNLSTPVFALLVAQSTTIAWGITVIVYISFSVVMCFKLAYWIYIWQLKEYRNDRMLDFFTTRTGKGSLLNIWFATEVVFALLFTVQALPLPWLLIDVLFILFIGVQVLRYAKHHITPVWTMKALLLEGAGTVGVALIVVFGLWVSVSELFLFAVLLVVAPLLVSTLVLVMRPFTRIHHQRVFARAAARIKQLHPIVIGVTGSYGKTSTKHFLTTMLLQQGPLLATPAHVNVDIGVAQTVLRDLKPEHRYFIVEMGAYREGEIASTCTIVSPMVGVLLAIGQQHLSLFGSVEAIQRAKSELLRALPSSGLAVINADDSCCVAAAEATDARKRFFSVQHAAHVYATDIAPRVDSVRFTLHVRDKFAVVDAALHGAQAIPSLLAAVTVADYFGLSLEQIVRGIELVTPMAGTMQLKRGINGCTVIDDSYNCNPDGYSAALDYLALFKDKRKIIVTPGMLELGAESDRLHRLVGARIGTVADCCVVTKYDFATPLRDGMKQSGMNDAGIHIDDRPRHVVETILHSLSPDDVVLLEGRVHPYYKEYVLSE